MPADKAPRGPARERQDHEEVGEAEAQRDGRVGRDVLEDARLSRDRLETRDRPLLEQDRDREEQVNADVGMREDREADQGRHERHEQEHLSVGFHDGRRVRESQNEGEAADDDGDARGPDRVLVARAPFADGGRGRRGHRAVRRANCVTIIATASTAATHGRAMRGPPREPSATQPSMKTIASAV